MHVIQGPRSNTITPSRLLYTNPGTGHRDCLAISFFVNSTLLHMVSARCNPLLRASSMPTDMSMSLQHSDSHLWWTVCISGSSFSSLCHMSSDGINSVPCSSLPFGLSKAYFINQKKCVMFLL